MTLPIKTLALVSNNNAFQKDFFQLINDYYSHLFSLSVIDSIEENQLSQYQLILTFEDHSYLIPALRFSMEVDKDKFTVNESLLANTETIWRLGQLLSQTYISISELQLDKYPYQLRISDKNGQFTYHNYQFNDSFFLDDSKELESWILRQLQMDKDLAYKHFLLPSASLDHIYVQSFFPLRDKEGNYLGSFDIVQDIKPILADYLEETAQAIVGWSDVTSGPSISDDF